jgi:hypothetical protein
LSQRQIFKKIGSSEKRNLLLALIESKVEFVAKGEGVTLFKMTPQVLLREGNILVDLIPPLKPIKYEALVVNFNFNNERYFFQSRWTTGPEVGSLALDVTSEFFLLQRRKSPRLEIPQNYVGFMNIYLYQNKTVFLEARLHDFGTGGCRLIFAKKTPVFITGEPFQGFLKLGKKSPFDLKCEVRHVFSDQAQTSQGQIFGVQFIELTSLEQNRLLVIFMDLQRNLFLSRPGMSS